MSNERDISQQGLNTSQILKKNKSNLGEINNALMRNISSLDEENVSSFYLIYFILFSLN